MKNRPGLNNTAIWIGLLLVLLIVLNVIAFSIYRGANPGENLWVQLWNYLESAIFKVITVSLILPLILFALESRFKIAEAVKQNRLMRKRKQEEERSEKRWECIEQTSKIWNQLWDLTSEIIYFKKDSDKGTTIEDLLIRLRNLTTSAEDVLNMWSHRFPDLPAKYYESFLMFFNTELDSAETVAWCIRYSKSEREIRKMQNSLRRIVESINYLVHHKCIDVLKYSMELLELKEANVSEGKQHDITSEIDEATKNLKEWADAISREEYRHNKPFSFANTPDVKALREKYQKLAEWMLENPKKSPDKDYAEYDNFSRLFYKIPHEQAGPYFSKDFVLYLANWISLESERAKLLYWVEEQQ
jgi:hypothetical protein